MKQLLLSLGCLFLLPLTLSAQCERGEYRIIIRLVQEDLEARDYQNAIERLLDARDICPDERVKLNGMIKCIFRDKVYG